MEPITILTSLIPFLQDAGKAAVRKFLGSAKPATAEEAIKLAEADNRRLETLAKLDTVGNVAQWVSNVRALQRPTIGLVLMSIYAYTLVSEVDTAIASTVANLTASYIFYLFGERSLLYIKRE